MSARLDREREIRRIVLDEIDGGEDYFSHTGVNLESNRAGAPPGGNETEGAMPLTQETFAALVLEDTDGRWELHGGKLREKPEMSFGHNSVSREIVRQLNLQLPPRKFEVLQNAGHVTLPDGDSYVPDVAIVPSEMTATFRARPRQLEAYVDPLPLVVEIWSPSTGNYDIDKKIPGYQLRGDFEIWRVHPFECVVTTWRRQPDGSYSQAEARAGVVRLHALPNVSLDLDQLFPTE